MRCANLAAQCEQRHDLNRVLVSARSIWDLREAKLLLDHPQLTFSLGSASGLDAPDQIGGQRFVRVAFPQGPTSTRLLRNLASAHLVGTQANERTLISGFPVLDCLRGRRAHLARLMGPCRHRCRRISVTVDCANARDGSQGFPVHRKLRYRFISIQHSAATHITILAADDGAGQMIRTQRQHNETYENKNAEAF